VRNRFPRSITWLAVLLGTLVAANGSVDAWASATAMACCAKANYTCAGLRAPDDCCKRAGHTVGPTAPGTIASTHLPVVESGVNPAFFFEILSDSTQAPPSGAVKRPHDPPHLHAFNLLI